MFDDLRERGETIEECYEFMLAYAAQGLPSDEGSRTGGQVREFLGRAVKAMDGLAESFAALIEQEGLAPAAKYRAFLAVLDRDARDSLAALELVLAQPVISSQLIDNLNASIHLRALLTDMFLVGEIMEKQQSVVKPQE
ncbi:MAG: hypothetical protein ACLQVL_24590 [Terriglobia bacterium]